MQLLQWLSCLKAGNTPHAVFLVGPAGSGKKEYARQAAALYLLGTEDGERLSECPFFQELPDYAIKTVRACCEELNRQVFARGRRCLVIPDAHKLTAQTQNALLKTLEEPPEDALLIWLQVYPIRQLAALADGVPSLAERYATEAYMTFRSQALPVIEEALFGVTPFAKAAELLERREEGKKKVGKDALADFLDILLSLLRDALLQRLGAGDGRNTDARPLENRVAEHFTTAEIQCMIAEALKERQVLMEFGGAAGSVLDALLVSLRKQDK